MKTILLLALSLGALSAFAMDIDLSKTEIFEVKEDGSGTLDMALRFPINQFENGFCIADKTIGNSIPQDEETEMRVRNFRTAVAMGARLVKITVRPSDYSEYPSPKYQRVDVELAKGSGVRGMATSIYCKVKDH